MAKFLLFVLVLAVIYLLLRASKRGPTPPPVSPGPEAMAQCAHCGVHFPHSETVSHDGKDYCSEEHRRLGVGT